MVDRESKLSYNREYYQRNKKRLDANNKLWAEKNREKNLKIAREATKRYRLKCRLIVFDFYSKGSNACNCCGEQTYEFLCIDHINGGGRKDRQNPEKAGSMLYPWLIKNNFPDGFQILCHNCNMAKGFYGKCPHKK